MIVLYRYQISTNADRVEAELKDMLAGYAVKLVNGGANPNEVPVGVELPAVADNGNWVWGEEPLNRLLDELRELMAEWNWFEGDTCYLDNKGNPC